MNFITNCGRKSHKLEVIREKGRTLCWTEVKHIMHGMMHHSESSRANWHRTQKYPTPWPGIPWSGYHQFGSIWWFKPARDLITVTDEITRMTWPAYFRRTDWLSQLFGAQTTRHSLAFAWGDTIVLSDTTICNTAKDFLYDFSYSCRGSIIKESMSDKILIYQRPLKQDQTIYHQVSHYFFPLLSCSMPLLT